MSRECTALYGSTEEDIQSDGLEVLIVEGGFTSFSQGDNSSDVARFLTVLLNFDVAPRPVEPLRGVVASMNYILEHCFKVPWDRLELQLPLLLTAYPPSAVNLVVRLPPKVRLGAEAERLVDSTLARLTAAGGHRLGVVAGLAVETQEWAQLEHLRHFVASRSEHLDRDTAAVFKAVATMMAPSAILEWDVVDLEQALGSAGSPARVAHAAWHHDQERLRFLSDDDAERAGSTRSAFVCPLFSVSRLGTTSKLMEAWRGQAHPNASACFSVVSGFFEPTIGFRHESSPVVAICQSPAAD